jgi:hypothetical protein
MSDYLGLFRSVYDMDKGNIEQVLGVLKAAGATQMECVIIVKKELGISLVEADHLITNSIVWKEKKDVIDKLKNDFGDLLESS